MELDVKFTVSYRTRIIVPNGESIADALSNIKIPEDEASTYCSDSFFVDDFSEVASANDAVCENCGAPCIYHQDYCLCEKCEIESGQN